MNEIVKHGSLVSTFDDAARAAKAMAQSGYFSDAREIAQAMVKIMAGHEMGFGPFAAMNGVHIINGKPAVGANLMAAAVKSHPHYDYRVTQMNNDVVEISFYQNGVLIGVSSFSKQDAQEAGLMRRDNWQKYTRNMLFARAMSNGVRWFVPDVFAGNAVYTPEELDGDIVEAEIREVKTPEPDSEAETVAAAAAKIEQESGQDLLDAVEEVPLDEPEPEPEPSNGKHWIEDEQTRKRFWAWIGEQGLDSDAVHEVLGVESVKDFDGSKKDAMDLILGREF